MKMCKGAKQVSDFIDSVYEAAEERSKVDDERGRSMRPLVEMGTCSNTGKPINCEP